MLVSERTSHGTTIFLFDNSVATGERVNRLDLCMGDGHLRKDWKIVPAPSNCIRVTGRTHPSSNPNACRRRRGLIAPGWPVSGNESINRTTSSRRVGSAAAWVGVYPSSAGIDS